MRYIIVSLILLSTLWSQSAYEKGEYLYFSKACSSCHGPSAEGSMSYPKLAHKKYTYLHKKLFYFRVGKVSSVSEQMMAQFAKKLSDEEIRDLCTFFSEHKDVKVEEMNDDYLGGVGS